jgi:hypothetical protein
MFGLAVVAERAVALVDLLELPRRVGTVPGVPPHLLAFYEEGIPVVHPRVNGQQPAPWFGRSLRHP